MNQSGWSLFFYAFIYASQFLTFPCIAFHRGVPVRIEIGPRDVTHKIVVVSRHDVPGKQGKEFGVSIDPSILVNHIKGRLEDIQASLLQKAITFRDRYLLP